MDKKNLDAGHSVHAGRIESFEGRGLILYDGECGFCLGWVQFILERDPSGYFVFAPLRSPLGSSMRIGLPKAHLESIVLYEDGSLYTKSTAVFRIARRLDSAFRYFWVLRFLPSGLRDLGYDLVAKRRLNLSAKCSFRSEDLNRFIVK